MLITSEHNLTAEIAYRQERIARDWAAANERRTSRRFAAGPAGLSCGCERRAPGPPPPPEAAI
jgi:hypothetical protein